MQNRVAIITGASGGMGLAVAQRWAASRRLVLSGTSEAKLQAVLEQLPGEGHVTVAGDLADPDLPGRIAAAAARLGSFAALFHAAGMSPTMGEPERLIEVNLNATIRLVDALLPLANAGSVAVLVSSIAGHSGVATELDELLDAPIPRTTLARVAGQMDDLAAYAAAKRAVILLAEQRAPAWGEKGARIVSLSPGMIDTAMWRLEMGEHTEHMSALLSMTPLLRVGGVEEIADIADFLCSPQASFVTGSDIKVDGGVVAAIQRQTRIQMAEA